MFQLARLHKSGFAGFHYPKTKLQTTNNLQNLEKMEKQTIEEIRQQYPDQWVLVGDPELKDGDTLGSIISKLERGFVLLASKDKRETGYKTKEARKGFKSITCIYTGDASMNPKWVSIFGKRNQT
jgi:hypothetical protein